MAMETIVPDPRDYAEKRPLHGPFSPLEMRMYGKVKSLIGATVKIEDDSVNSVLLDDQPKDNHERILVAGQVGTQLNQNRVVARSTTLLPNIPGLPAILTLMFAPRAEFRCNSSRTQLTGAVCGLGFDPLRNNQPYYPEHDMELTFDAEISLNVCFFRGFAATQLEFRLTYSILSFNDIFKNRMCCSSTRLASG